VALTPSSSTSLDSLTVGPDGKLRPYREPTPDSKDARIKSLEESLLHTRQRVSRAVGMLRSVLCDPRGNMSMWGSDADRSTAKAALEHLDVAIKGETNG
jgi:hypothetical protein